MSSINGTKGFVKIKCPNMRLTSNVFFDRNYRIIVKICIKSIRSKGHRSNPLKRCDVIMKVPLRQAHFHFFLSPHEILKFKNFA